MADESVIRRAFLFLSIALTLFGCIIAALGMALPAWQVVELLEFNSVHEHGVFYDCIRSEPSNFLIPLERLKKTTSADSTAKGSGHTQKKCTSKFDSISASTWTMRQAIEDGDPAAREQLFHRFLRESS